MQHAMDHHQSGVIEHTLLGTFNQFGHLPPLPLYDYTQSFVSLVEAREHCSEVAVRSRRFLDPPKLLMSRPCSVANRAELRNYIRGVQVRHYRSVCRDLGYGLGPIWLPPLHEGRL